MAAIWEYIIFFFLKNRIWFNSNSTWTFVRWSCTKVNFLSWLEIQNRSTKQGKFNIGPYGKNIFLIIFIWMHFFSKWVLQDYAPPLWEEKIRKSRSFSREAKKVIAQLTKGIIFFLLDSFENGPTCFLDNGIDICCFFPNHSTLRSKSKDWLAQNQNIVEWHV